jgi:hypothetical protein
MRLHYNEKRNQKQRGIPMDQRFEQTAFYPADILLPQTAEMKKWPVVACDQFTSQPDYWQAAEAAVGGSVSPAAGAAGGLSERPGCGQAN